MNDPKIVSLHDILEMISKGMKDFRNSKFYGVEFSGKDLSGVVFDGSSFEWCFFENSRLAGASFKKCDLKFCTFLSADLTKASFEGSKMGSVDFESATFNRTVIRNSELSYITFINVNLAEADLTGSSQFKVFMSWDELTEEDWRLLMQRLGEASLPVSKVLEIKNILGELKGRDTSIKFSYGDIGKSFASSGRAYTVSSGGKQSEVYLPWSSAYMPNAGYEAKKETKRCRSFTGNLLRTLFGQSLARLQERELALLALEGLRVSTLQQRDLVRTASWTVHNS